MTVADKMPVRKRQIDLDIAKGIGIILVVWGHAAGPFSHYIDGFHMPFLFPACYIEMVDVL